jgi:egghead protein (zeste-white 4 protein)
VRAPTVIFQVTAIGKNPNALEATVRSVLYWVRETPRLTYRYVVWLVIEPDGYATAPDVYEALRREGVRLLVVPQGYRTPLGTTGKGRALQYASEERIRLGLSDPFVWVYHQDEETCVGQDTLLGIAEFVTKTDAFLGTGVIIYPLDWNGSPSHIQELTRSFDDWRVLDSMVHPGNPTAGFHGSHFLVRADVEDSVGWDSRGYAPAEDLLFEIRLRREFGDVTRILKGFAYEKGAFTLADQLKQRRRWVHGVLYAIRRAPGIPRGRRFTLAYSALSWFSALPSVAVLVASAVLRYGPMLIVTGVFTGFIWTSMILAYVEGYKLHAAYVAHRMSILRMVLAGILGALVDVTAPWYALATQPSLGDFIPKDRPSAAAGHPLTDPKARRGPVGAA